MPQKILIAGVILCLSLVFTGCSVIEQTGVWKRPGVKFSKASITGLDPQGMILALDMDVSNPNSFGISYGALEYALSLKNMDVLSGLLDKSGSIAAGKTERVTLPITIKFSDISKLVSNFGSLSGTVPYAFAGSILLNIPVVGEVKLPVKTSGEFAMPRIPGLGLF